MGCRTDAPSQAHSFSLGSSSGKWWFLQAQASKSGRAVSWLVVGIDTRALGCAQGQAGGFFLEGLSLPVRLSSRSLSAAKTNQSVGSCDRETD
jgi:hypothetical protein